MATHHFTASDLVVDKGGWQSLDTFPQDGSTVEVVDDQMEICHAKWDRRSNGITTAKMWVKNLTGWRKME
jgi:hypothetical protein